LTAVLYVEQMGQRGDIQSSDLPLAIGLSQGDEIEFGNAGNTAPSAWLGEHFGQIFIQPKIGAVAPRLNGAALTSSAWLTSGDEIQIGGKRITVTDDGGVIVLTTSGDTGPPVLTPPDRAPDGNSQAPRVRTPEHLPPSSAPGLLPGRNKQRGVRNWLIGVFGLLALGVTFVLVAAPVRVAVTPEPDRMSLTGFPPPIPIGERYLVLPGDYVVSAEKAEYRKLAQPVAVAFGGESKFSFELRKLPGRLTVRTRPVSGARVEIGGKMVGETPLEDFEVEPGQIALGIAAPRYQPYASSIDIAGMGKSQIVDVELLPGWGTLVVDSVPPGATVSLNGEAVGPTPLRAEPMAGTYRVELRTSGRKPASATVRIEPTKTVTLPPFVLEKIDGNFALTTDPPGATVSVNGQFRGRSPIELALPSDRDHRLVMTKLGHTPNTRTIHVTPGQMPALHIRLEPEYGNIFLSSRPADAELKVDGKAVGSATRRLRLTTLAHRLEISRPGHVTESITVTPRKGLAKKLIVRLKRAEEPLAKANPDNIKTTGGQILRRVLLRKPVRFFVGAARREAGRRSNETRYEVELTRSFYISEKEVTNAEFRRFRALHKSGTANGNSLDGPDQPVASVSWDDAARYLNWLSAKDGLLPAYREETGKMVPVRPTPNGYRMPTEAEWVYLTRYEGGLRAGDKPLKYGWGNAFPPVNPGSNIADSSASSLLPVTVGGYSDGFAAAAPVGNFSPNQAGIHDLSSNVAEWCYDYYDTYTGIGSRVPRDPIGPVGGRHHVVRGASWRHGTITELRLSYRDYADKPRDDLGFRIARYANKSPK